MIFPHVDRIGLGADFLPEPLQRSPPCSFGSARDAYQFRTRGKGRGVHGEQLSNGNDYFVPLNAQIKPLPILVFAANEFQAVGKIGQGPVNVKNNRINHAEQYREPPPSTGEGGFVLFVRQRVHVGELHFQRFKFRKETHKRKIWFFNDDSVVRVFCVLFE